MKLFFRDLPENLEVVFMLVIGIILQIVDGSPFTIKERWKVVWETDLPAKHFSAFVQKFIKTVLSAIVMVRCTTTYAYVVASMLVIFCILKKTTPKLMRFWLLISAVKPISMIFLEGLTGVYVCSAFGRLRKACVEFFVVKAMELIFSTYLWGIVLNVYKDLEKKAEGSMFTEEKDQQNLRRQDFRRLRARSLIDESTLSKTTCLNNFERRDVPLIILQMLRRNDEISEDSLLAPGMMLASVSNLGSFDNIKTSQSLGELGFTDLTGAQVYGIEEDDSLSKQEKAMKFLKLTRSDVLQIRLNKSSVENDIYNVDDDIWKSVVARGINQPKQPRGEVFMRKVSPVDLAEDKSGYGSNHRQVSLLFSYMHKDKSIAVGLDDIQDARRYQEGQDEDEDEDRIFMSNVKDKTVNPFRVGPAFQQMKGVEYAKLYKQDFMSSIGPEVFDKASKLPKLTSLTKIRNLALSKQIRSKHELVRRKSRKMKVSDEDRFGQASNAVESERHGEDKPIDTDELTTGARFSRNRESSTEEKQQQEESSFTSELTFSEPKTSENLTESSTGSELKWEDEVKLPKPEEKEITEIKSGDEDVAVVKYGVEEVTEIKSGDEDKTKSQLEGEKVSEIKLENEKIVQRKPEKTQSGHRDVKTSPEVLLKENSSLKVQPSVTIPEPTLPAADNSEEGKMKPLDKKRTISIRWVGQRNPKILFHNQSSGSGNPSDDPDSVPDLPPKPDLPELEKKEPERSPKMSERGSNSNTGVSGKPRNSSEESFRTADNKQIYFVTELSKKPLYDVLVSYYDLKKGVYLKSRGLPQKSELQRGNNNSKGNEEILSFAPDSKHERKWKSKVLKRSQLSAESIPVESRNVVNTLKKKDAIKKLLKLEYYSLVKKYNSLSETKMDDFEDLCPNVKSEKSDTSNVSDNDSKVGSETSLNFTEQSESGYFLAKPSSQTEENTCEVLSSYDSELQSSDNLPDDDAQASVADITKAEAAFSDVRDNSHEKELLSSQESDEPISLYYSKAANLASPLLDMKGFIYPDHIHYSYKHVKKRGFDVGINGGFPLLMRESLTVGNPIKKEPKWAAKSPDCEIKRRPMDLSFAKTNTFVEWQNNDQNTSETILPSVSGSSTREAKVHRGLTEIKEDKRRKDSREDCDSCDSQESIKKEIDGFKSQGQNFSEFKYLSQEKDFMSIEKLLKMHKKMNTAEHGGGVQRKHAQISSTQLHSNKGRSGSEYNPAMFLQENRTGNEKKKSEIQKESAKEMFLRLEREALSQSKVVRKSNGHIHKI